MPVDCTISDDGSRLLATLSGTLEMADVSRLHERLLKCLAEQPDALLVELSGLGVADPLALSVFVAVRRQAARWPGIPMVLCAPSALARLALDSAAYRSLPVLATLAEARVQSGIERESLSTITDELLPITGASRQGRDVATDACARWGLPDLIGPASLITSELVSNVIDHAGTMMTLRLSLRPRFLQIAVRDGSTAEPVRLPPQGATAMRGRGLALIEGSAQSWGWLPCEGGKVVWASLSIDPERP
ncbi:ATP-binding protein [Actinoplanes friuliensis]|uniref:STAS domain-containing protein n=1 Tax=Actinoplanes friuliensis DSM 7358 TaxID=1246995 RepID=U5W3N0_9ACTN|nr:ATP-binding protein [Actinoplanes friuliensis]AGZ43622.1 hypothetical protein AFR_26800 [Actinoplanes friuliensis DSM 7358]